MTFFKPLFQLGVLSVLTALMCLGLIELLQTNPLYSLIFLFVCTLAILLTVDAL